MSSSSCSLANAAGKTGRVDESFRMRIGIGPNYKRFTGVVSFTDPEGIEHSVRVSAASLYEAAVLALAEFRRHGFADTNFGPATKLTVKIQEPEISHTVSVGRLKSWLDGERVPANMH